jgi:formylglycine-generating enzyme required for sulfatase activity
MIKFDHGETLARRRGEVFLDPQGSPPGPYRVFRGGRGLSYAGYCRSAQRGSLQPDYRDYDIGFRVVLAPGQP